MAFHIISFTAGGIDVESIVQGLMQVERQPITQLQTRQPTAQLQIDAPVARLRTSARFAEVDGATRSSPTASARSPSSVSSERRLGDALTARPRRLDHASPSTSWPRATGCAPRRPSASSSSIVTTQPRPSPSRPTAVAPRRLVGRRPEPASRPATTPCQSPGDRRRNPHRDLRARRRPPRSRQRTTRSTSSVDGVARHPSRSPTGPTTPPGCSAPCKSALDSPLVAVPPQRSTAPAASASPRPTRAPTATLQVTGGNALTRARPHRRSARQRRHRRHRPDRDEPAVTVTSAGTGADRRRPDREPATSTVDARRRSARRRRQRSPWSRPAIAAWRVSPRRSTAPTPASTRLGRQGRRRSMDPAAHRRADPAPTTRWRSTRTVFAGVGGLLQTSAAQDAADHDRHRSRRLLGHRRRATRSPTCSAE